MARAIRAAVIDAPIEETWKTIRPFEGLPAWHPSAESMNLVAGFESARRVGIAAKGGEILRCRFPILRNRAPHASGGDRRVGPVTGEEQRREEAQFRKIEGAMHHVEDAARRLDEAAKDLKKDGAAPHLITALETAAGAVRADHSRLVKSVYWGGTPPDEQGELTVAGGEQQRLAS